MIVCQRSDEINIMKMNLTERPCFELSSKDIVASAIMIRQADGDSLTLISGEYHHLSVYETTVFTM